MKAMNQNRKFQDMLCAGIRMCRRMTMLFVMVILCCACDTEENRGVQVSPGGTGKETADASVSAVNQGEDSVQAASGAAVPDSAGQESLQGEVTVYVCGAVAVPGVYTLPAGSRMAEAVAAAGGMTPEADTDVLNLAQYMSDGQMIRIPLRGEVTQSEEEPQLSSAEDDGSSNGKVNINTASVTELMTIPGIGQSKAQAIIAYRESKGKFGKKEDIMQIDGIKEASFAKMEPYICVE